MASQYQKMKEKYDKYVNSGVADQGVVREMDRLMQYANIVDTDKAKTASDILNSRE